MIEQNKNKRLRTEAEKLLQSAESIYWHELEKPKAERDADLLAECLLTIEQANSVLSYSEPKKKRSFSVVVRWAAAVVAVIFVLAATGVGVARAMGIDVWNLLFRHSETGLEAEGKPASHAPDFSDLFSGEHYERQKISDFDEGISELGINPLNLDLTKHGYIVDNIYISKNDVALELFAEYLTDGGYADVAIQLYNSGDSTSFINEMLGSYEKTECTRIADMYVYYANDGRDTSLLWTDGVYIYSVNTNKTAKEMLDIIRDAAR